MNDASVILTKNSVLQKVKELFIGMQQEMQEAAGMYPGHAAFAIPPKISRGENYLGLPYLILDYPRIFRREDSFAIRSMFWWGRYFSSTLHLAGSFREQALERLAGSYPLLAEKGYFISIHQDPWLHQYDADVYTPVSDLDIQAFRKQCGMHGHVKTGLTWPLTDIPKAREEMMKSWKFLLDCSLA